MRACVLEDKEKLVVRNIVEENVNKDLVKVTIAYTGVCGSDIPRVLQGKVHSYPIVLGHEFSGIVSEIGEDVKSLSIGDHVVGIPLVPCFACEACMNGNYSLCKHYSFYGSRKNGSYAESIVLSEKNLFKISKNISLKDATFFEPITVAYHALLHSDYMNKNNKYVAILGNGTIGLFLLQLIKQIDSKTKVVMFSRNKGKFSLAKRLGADECFSTLDNDFIEESLNFTDEKGYDYVFETAGSTNTMQISYELVANKSIVCLIGTPTRNLEFTPKLWELLNRKEFYLTGSWMSYSSPFPGKEWIEVEKLLSSKQLKVDNEMIYGIYDLEHITFAFDDFKNGKVKGKVLIKNNSGSEIYEE